MSVAVDMSPVCLRATGLVKRFGGFYALRNVDIELERGSIHAVIGPNGAGKTTLFNLLSGLLPCDEGRIELGDTDLNGMRPNARSALGLARTFQNIRLFEGMTVLENVMLGNHRHTYPTVWPAVQAAFLRMPFGKRASEQIMQDRALEILEFVGLGDAATANATDLPYGQRRLLELARALATEPTVLMLDEPAAGMNPHETDELDQLMSRIRDRGVTILLVEHDMNLVMGVSDVVTVLNFGEKIAEGSPFEIQKNPAVIEAYLGEEEAL